MKKKSIYIISLFLLSLWLASCNSDVKPTTETKKTVQQEQEVKKETKTEDNKNKEEASTPKKNEVKEINIVTDRSDSHLTTIAKQFEEETWVKVNISRIDKWLLSKIENRENEGDIYITKSSTEIIKAADKDLLAKIPADLVANVDDLHKGDEWVNMSFRDRAFYIKKGVKDFPHTYEGLANPKWKGKLCIRPLTHHYNIEMISNMLVKHGEEYTKAWLDGLIKNMARKPTWNDRAQVKGIYDGVCEFSVWNTYYMGLMLENPEQKPWADNVNLFFPNQEVKDEEHVDGAIALYSAIGVNKNSINKKPVQEFLIYVLSPASQQLITDATYEYPIVKDVPVENEIVKDFGKFQNLKPNEIKQTTISQEETAKVRDQVLKIISEAEMKNGL